MSDVKISKLYAFLQQECRGNDDEINARSKFLGIDLTNFPIWYMITVLEEYKNEFLEKGSTDDIV
ncbi:MAG: hypothetical protein ACTSRA_00615 [Promethearchaeota archaeon]